MIDSYGTVYWNDYSNQIKDFNNALRRIEFMCVII